MRTNLQFVTNRARSPANLYRGEFGKWFHSAFEISSRRTHFLRQEKGWIQGVLHGPSPYEFVSDDIIQYCSRGEVFLVGNFNARS